METNGKTEVLTQPQAAKVCAREGIGLSYRQLRQLVMTGRLKSFRNGKRWYVSMSLLRQALKDPASSLWSGDGYEE